MTKELVNPNLHVVLVHFPLALLVAGLAVEILSVLYRRTTLRAAGRWMILLGAMAAVPTALSGAYAFADVARRAMPPGARVDVPWYRVLRETRVHSSSPGSLSSSTAAGDSHAGESDQWKMMARHAWVQGPATGLAVLTVVVALALTDRWRRRLYLPLLLLLLAATGLMIWGAWYGGDMVYRYGTGVALSGRDGPPTHAAAATGTGAAAVVPDVPPPATGPAGAVVSTSPATEPATIPATTTSADGTPVAGAAASMPAAPATSPVSSGTAGEPMLRKSLRSAPYYLPPLQLHVILAGCAVALALAALGLSWRASARTREPADAVSEAELLRDQPDEPGRRRATAGDVAVLRSFKPDVALQVEPPEPVPAGRTWLLALLVAVLAILAGWWFLAHASEAFDRSRAEYRPVTAVLWEQVTTAPDDAPSGTTSGARHTPWPTRRLAHVLAAGGIALVVLLLAATARWARQRRGLIAACGLLLVLLVGVQLWLGVLLLFDTPAGSVYHFQRPPPAAAGDVVATP